MRMPMPTFLQQMVRNYNTTGAIWPSSRGLALAMTRPIRDFSGPRRILEVGPGTGAFSRQILTTLESGDEYHLVEISELFCERIERDVLSPFRESRPNIDIQLHQAPIEAADILIALRDPVTDWPEGAALPRRPDLWCVNKIDMAVSLRTGDGATCEHPLGISALTGAGIDTLEARLVALLGLDDLRPDQLWAFSPTLREVCGANDLSRLRA